MTRSRPGALLAAALILASCGGGEEATDTESDTVATDAPDDEPTLESTTPDTAGEPATTDPTDEVIARCGYTGSYEEVPCDEPHDAEFVGTVPIPDDPGDVAGNVALKAACGPSVEAVTGRPMTVLGVDAGFFLVADSASDVPHTLECWAEVSAPDALTASIRDDGLAAAIGDFAFIADLEVGTCFVLADPTEETVDLATVTDCGDAGAELLFGRFEADDGPPPDDATRDGFDARCRDLADEGGFPSPDDAETWYLISPKDVEWEAHGRRTVMCVMVLAEEMRTDPSGAVGPVCANYDADLQDYPIVPCDEPHSAEFAGSVTPPPGDLPDDPAAAVIVLNQLCRERVEALTGRSLDLFGSGVGFVSSDGLGQPMVSDIRCYVSVSLDGAFTAAIGDVGYDAALAYEIVADLEPGTCFTEAGEAFSFAELTPCDAPGSLMAVGGFLADDPPGRPYPGIDALRAVRTERCGAILAESGLAADPATVSGVVPSEAMWLSYDQRQITCDAVPLT